MVDKAFLGRGWSFPPEFNRSSGEVNMVSEDEDIQESLRILLTTAPGERVMNPAYGCGLKLITFENISESTVTEIKDVIERAILFFEPRINLNGIDITTENAYEGVVIGSGMADTLPWLNSKTSNVFSFQPRQSTKSASP